MLAHIHPFQNYNLDSVCPKWLHRDESESESEVHRQTRIRSFLVWVPDTRGLVKQLGHGVATWLIRHTPLPQLSEKLDAPPFSTLHFPNNPGRLSDLSQGRARMFKEAVGGIFKWSRFVLCHGDGGWCGIRA